MSLTYKDSGVDVQKGDELVERIKKKVKSTYGDRVQSGVGGFACLYKVADRLLAAGTDGVGTKLKLAFECDQHDSVGIDLVAMCVNDILCTGAKPLFFMDYLACGSLNLKTSESIIDGVVKGCLDSEAALIGGETAEMPGMYKEGEYDLAGFAVGEVTPDKLIDGSGLAPGQSLIGLRSNGIHSNGLSLVRKIIEDESLAVKRRFLRPTQIYWQALKPLLENNYITGAAHITGGGIHNLKRINKSVGFDIDYSSDDWINKFFDDDYKYLKEKGSLDFSEMMSTFNCGIGMMICTNDSKKVLSALEASNIDAFELGKVSANGQKVNLRDLSF